MAAIVALGMTTAATPANAELRFVPRAPKLSLATTSSLTTAPIQITKPPPLRLTSMITLAAGAATIGVSIFLGLHSRELRRASREHCPDGLCDGQGYELQNRSGSFGEAATITMAAGGGLLIAGGLLLVLGPKPGLPRMDGANAGVRLVPGLGRVDLKGTF